MIDFHLLEVVGRGSETQLQVDETAPSHYLPSLELLIFTYLKLWVAVAKHNFKWVKQPIVSSAIIRMIDFHPLEVVGRGSETQLLMDETAPSHYPPSLEWLIFTHLKLWVAVARHNL